MGLTDFGKVIRKARIDLGETLSTMAESLEVTPGYLSGMETGRKNISDEWVIKITNFFKTKNFEISDLRTLADIANKSVSIEGLDPHKQMLISGFARANLDAETLEKLASLLGAIEEERQ